MENTARYGNGGAQRRSGYEPSDTETERYRRPRDRKSEVDDLEEIDSDFPRNLSPLKANRRNSSKIEHEKPSSPKANRRKHRSKSPYRPWTSGEYSSPDISLDFAVKQSSQSKFEKPRNNNLGENEEIIGSNRRGIRTPPREKPNYSRRSATAPRQRGEKTVSPFSKNKIRNQREASQPKSPSIGEINEMIADTKISKGSVLNAGMFDSTDSLSPGDIFFSRDQFAARIATPKPNGAAFRDLPKPPGYLQSDSASNFGKAKGDLEQKRRGSSSAMSRTTATSRSGVSRQSSSGKFSISRVSEATSGRSSISLSKFTANRQKSSQSEGLFACMRRGSCRSSKSPEKTAFDEAAFIEKAFVVEKIRQFWADKHQPASLNGFICHKQEAQILMQLVSNESVPHILFKGPPGAGKRALAMALLREIYGDPAWNVSHELRNFKVQENRPKEVLVSLTSSAHHMELNVNTELNAKHALMGLVKEISNSYVITPEISTVSFKADYKVLVLYQVDKAGENIQHLIKWIMDCYVDACKLILCCEDDVDILDSVKNRCRVIDVDSPATHEIMEVLVQIARKEDFDLSMTFAAKIASKSKHNLRKAIMALEACKAHNYPFVDDQPIPLGWEEILVELAAEILADPSHKRLFSVRGKFQKLLIDFVHPKLILLKLVEQFLKGVDGGLKREIYYWHAYYEKRLPTGTSAMLKLEEFVAKFMGIYRKTLGNHHQSGLPDS